MKLDYSKANVTESDLLKAANSLGIYLEELAQFVGYGGYGRDEASINLPSDTTLREEIEAVYRDKCLSGLKYIVVCGIGGSNLGTKAVYEALLGGQVDVFGERFPKMLFVSTNDSHILRETVTLLGKEIHDPCEVLIVSASKSGTTTETIANTEILISALKTRFKDRIFEQCVVITDNNSGLAEAARAKGMSVMAIPENVGGRYSVLSAVGLFPLFAAGIDIDAVRMGAESMRGDCLQKDPKKNPALQSAAVLYTAIERGKTIHTNFIFHPELESLGKWYRQLLGESIGKKKDNDGNIIRAGITPDISVGSDDLHSVGQLDIGGPQDKITTFIYTEKVKYSVPVPKERTFPGIVPMIEGKSAEDIMDAIFEGVKIAYDKEELPFMEILLADISPYEIGQFLQFKMMEIMYLAQLLNVNAFNQPSVEAYKTETKKILEGK